MVLVRNRVQGRRRHAPGMMTGRINLGVHRTISQLIGRAALVRNAALIKSVLEHQFGWSSDRRLILHDACIELVRWHNRTDPHEPRKGFVQEQLKAATLYEWLCFAGSNAAQANRMMDQGHIVLIQERGYILIQKFRSGKVFISEATTLPGGKKPIYYAGTYLR